MYDLTDPVANGQAVFTYSSDQCSPAISGRKIVWQDNRNAATSGEDIYMYDLDHPELGAQPICTATGNQLSPEISGDIIVWTDCRNDPDECWGEIYMYNLGSPFVNGEPVCDILANAGDPAVSGNIILWIDRRDASPNGQIYMYDLEHPVTNGRRLCPSSSPQGPAVISGNTVVWCESSSVTQDDIYWTSILDTHAPITTAVTAPSDHCGWYNGDVYVMLSAVDPCSGSGVASTEYSWDLVDWYLYEDCHDILVTGEGTHTVYYRSTDYAGNVEYYQWLTLQIDLTDPITSVSPPPLPASGWYTDKVLLEFSATDSGGSGVWKTEYSPDLGVNYYPVPAGGQWVCSEGENNILYRSIDLANNHESAQSITIRIDKSAPVTTATVSSLYDYDCGWYQGPVTVTLSAHDPCSHSGVASTEYSLNNVDWLTYGPEGILLDQDGIHTVYYRSTDNAGNVEVAGSVIVQIDLPEPMPAPVIPQSSAVTIELPPLENIDPIRIIIDWGDGNVETIFPIEATLMATTSLFAPLSSTPVPSTATHVYTSPGVFTITGTIEYGEGMKSTWTADSYVVVYDPSGGFVTGGGWINSPAGAYLADPTLTGKANFGFVAKYKKGTTVPDGNTEFQFKAGDLNFKSTSYDWLVVAGARAQYKGTGTINGAGEYGFILTAIDGQVNGGGGVDKFRIKIWDRTTGVIVYDNQLGESDAATPSTILGGGSIVVHK